MTRTLLLMLLATTICCTGGTCVISGPDGTIFPPGSSSAALDRATADILIVELIGDSEAEVLATIKDTLERTVELGDGRSVEIDDLVLADPQAGVFAGTLPADSTYTLTVREPTRGVETTTLTPPGDFAVTSPAAEGDASLSGFTLSWSDADANAMVEIEFQQTFAGETEAAEFGPFVDEGQRELSAADLRDFVQGADLIVTVTKIREIGSLAGFASGTATLRKSVVHVVEPRP